MKVLANKAIDLKKKWFIDYKNKSFKKFSKIRKFREFLY